MARKRPGFYHTIEYIGPRPQKPKRQNFFGGWVILALAGGIAFWFGKPLVQSLNAAQNGASAAASDTVISRLGASARLGDRLAAVAISHSYENVTYDSSYYAIEFPGGDVPANKGKAEDVIIRCYRRLGIDLQKEVNEDMSANFGLYPTLFNATAPDPNIDHRRVQNLHRFFSRHGESLSNSRNSSHYEAGDIVIWSLSSGKIHIGVVVPSPNGKNTEPWIVHNNGEGVKWESGLFDYTIVGHFRYAPKSAETAAVTPPATEEETF